MAKNVWSLYKEDEDGQEAAQHLYDNLVMLSPWPAEPSEKIRGGIQVYRPRVSN